MAWHNSKAYHGLMYGAFVAALWFVGKAGYMEAKAELAQYLLEAAWEKHLQDGQSHKPWPWADTTPIARLAFPEHDKQQVVLAGASGRNLAFAPAHLSASVLPGHTGVSVIGGHRDTHFAFLQHVQKGNTIVMQDSKGHRHTFTVDDIMIADVRHSEIRLDAAEPVLALVACYPFDAKDRGGPLRYLVIAKKPSPNRNTGLAQYLMP